MRNKPVWIVTLVLATAGIVATAAVAQAIREHSWDPIWAVGWIPAALIAVLAGPRTAGQCRRPRHRRSRS